jgi:hypothetical protein
VTDPAPQLPPHDPFAPAPVSGPVPAAAVPPPVVRARPSRASGLVNVLLGVAVVVAVGGVAFAAGRATAPAAAASNGGLGGGRFGNGGTGNGGFGGPNASGAPGFGGGGFGGLGGGGLSVEGTVEAVSSDSITLRLANGQTVTIPVNAQTTWHQQEASTPSAVVSGSTVIVQLQGGRGAFGGGGGNGATGGNGGPAASGQPGRTLPAATSITLAPSGS